MADITKYNGLYDVTDSLNNISKKLSLISSRLENIESRICNSGIAEEKGDSPVASMPTSFLGRAERQLGEIYSTIDDIDNILNRLHSATINPNDEKLVGTPSMRRLHD